MTETKRRAAAAPAGTQLTGWRRGTDTAYAAVQILFALALLVQVYLAGFGAFAHRKGGFDAHETFGDVLGIVAVVLFVLALLAWVGRWTVIGAFVVGVLTETAQHGLAQGGHHHPVVGGLHALDGMIILIVAAWLAVTAYRRRFAGAR
jgi:hypothetical protein